MNLLDAAILGIVEGVTEFLPISSTGHLIVAASLLGVHGSDKVKTFEIAIQAGAIAAVLWAYWERFRGVFLALPSDRSAQRFALNLILAFAPAALVGLLFSREIKTYLFNPVGVAIASVVGALVIFWVERNPEAREARARIQSVDAMGPLDALKIGLAQCASLIPGISRSGATLIGGMLFGMNRTSATEFSFFLGVPTLTAASLFSLWKDWALLTVEDLPAFAVGAVVSFLVALAVIRWLIRFVATHTLVAFAWYRILFGALILLAAWTGWVQW
ncbi:MAG: undecaprenyl-diphosphate phosphatase [Burkholderiales bacterium]|nr:undecaprenyl-diphosphate phosphatase [Burkholderiales bacterium]